SDLEIVNRMTAGSMAGELSGLLNSAARGTYRAVSRVKALRIPCGMYIEFLKRNGLYDDLKKDINRRRFLQSTWLFGELLSCPLKSRLTKFMDYVTVPAGEAPPDGDNPRLFIVENGALEVLHAGRKVETIGPSGFFGEEKIVKNGPIALQARALEETRGYTIPADALSEIPIVQWKLLETLERRLKE
ncbi:MAG TPA: cyclic nucleotide-binding domain-containing protein, partial [bacterium]|nr:cyclic nucleotide-binding domain-containing protein [bacterium]